MHGTMYALIGKMRCTPGNREQLASLLLGGTTAMPGCLSYIVANDPTDADAIWITEVWDSAANHRASLSLPDVQQAIAALSANCQNLGMGVPRAETDERLDRLPNATERTGRVA